MAGPRPLPRRRRRDHLGRGADPRLPRATRVAVVLPYGSRVATSRINFRLLARDAMTNGKRLSIVAGDAATRALAASAGLPIFATVGEYEASVEGGGGDGGGTRRWRPLRPGEADDGRAAARPCARRARPRGRRDGSRRRRGRRRGRGDGRPRSRARPSPARPRGRRRRGGHDGRGRRDRRPAVAPGASTARRATRAPAATPRPASSRHAGAPAAERDRPRPPEPSRPVRRRSSPIGRTPLLVGLAVLALAVVVGGAGAFLFLPTATAVVTPREETLGPIVAADRGQHDGDRARSGAPDRAGRVDRRSRSRRPTPSRRPGKRVEETKAKGAVRFDNLDPTSSNTIARGQHRQHGFRRPLPDRQGRHRPAGRARRAARSSRRARRSTSPPSTPGPRATSSRTRITNVPRGEEPFFLKVTNPDATGGGKRTEFPRVTQEDVDAAVAALDATELDSGIRGSPRRPGPPRRRGHGVPGDARRSGDADASASNRRPSSARRSRPSTSGRRAPARSSAVDTAPVEAVAEARIESSVAPGYAARRRLERGRRRPGRRPTGSITFPVVVTARQVPLLDPDAIEREIMGKPLGRGPRDPRDLRRGGADVWPDWVGTVPTLDIAGRGPSTRPNRRSVAVTRALGVDLGERRIGVAIADGPGAGAPPADDAPRAAATSAVDAAALLALIHDQRDRRARRRPADRRGRARRAAGRADAGLGRGHPRSIRRPCHDHPARRAAEQPRRRERVSAR